MKENIPVNAPVECSDGVCGESVTVTVDPTTRQITHLVVEEKAGKAVQRLVPMDRVVESTSGLIRLDCSKQELAEMEPFIETHFIESGPGARAFGMYYDHYTVPLITTKESYELPVEQKRVPLGELAIHRGTQVEAQDGPIGKVGELVLDAKTRKVTHLVLQEGHRWGKKQIVLPLSAVDFAFQDIVYVKLDTKAIEQLPTIPVKRQYLEGTVSVDLVAKVFDDAAQANEALVLVEGLHRQKTVKILNAAVLVKEQDGTTSVQDTRDIDPKRGRLLGAITGGLIGLVAGPVGAVVGALAGAGAGGLAGKWIDMGFSNRFLTGLQERMQPGSAAVVVLVEHDPDGKFQEIMAETEGVIFEQALTDALVEDLMAEDEAES